MEKVEQLKAYFKELPNNLLATVNLISQYLFKREDLIQQIDSNLFTPKEIIFKNLIPLGLALSLLGALKLWLLSEVSVPVFSAFSSLVLICAFSILFIFLLTKALIILFSKALSQEISFQKLFVFFGIIQTASLLSNFFALFNGIGTLLNFALAVYGIYFLWIACVKLFPTISRTWFICSTLITSLIIALFLAILSMFAGLNRTTSNPDLKVESLSDIDQINEETDKLIKRAQELSE